MSWVLLTVVGALINVAVNYGYKVVAGGTEMLWVVSAVLGMASLTFLCLALATRRQGWRLLLKGRMPVAVMALGIGVAVAFVLFLGALSTGPISLVDPLWACVYALVSLLIGMLLIRERPALLAIVGIALYMVGAAFIGLTDYAGSDGGNLWALFVLVGATVNGFINYGYKTCAAKVDAFILMTVVYFITALGLAMYGLYENSNGWMSLGAGHTPLMILLMGVFTPCFVFMMIRALVRGPISLVDPLWACVYALGSIAIGMLAAAEEPATGALIGVALYLVGAYLMGRNARNISKRR